MKQILNESYPIASAAVKLPERKNIFVENIRFLMNKDYPHLSETINKRNNITIYANREKMVLEPRISIKLKMLFLEHNPEALI